MDILKWLPLITVAGAGAVGFGQQQQKIITMEDAIKAQTAQQAVVVEVQKTQAANDARLEMVIELLKEIRQKVDDN